MPLLRPKLLAGATWPDVAIGGIVGTVSAGLLDLVVPRMISDYLLFPMVKDAYIFPEWHYRIFDAVLVGWCIDGVIAAVLLLGGSTIRPGLRPWARRTTFLYVVGLAILICGVVFGMWLRGHGI